MSWKGLIATVDKTDNIVGEMDIDLALNGRSTASFQCKPGYIPDRFQDVQLYANDLVTVLFGGLVNVRAIVEPEQGSGQVFTDVECADYFIYGDWTYTSRVYTAPVAMGTVLANLATDMGNGVTIHASQVAGPTLDPFSSWADGVRINDAIRDLMGRCPGYVAKMSTSKVLRAELLGTASAPYAMTDAEPRNIKFLWRDPDTAPITKVTLICGPSGTILTRQAFISNGVATSWVTDLPASDPPPTLVEINDGVTPQLLPIGTGAHYEWNRATHTLSLGTAPMPAAGTRIVIGPNPAYGDTYTQDGYAAQYPFQVTATTGATPVVEERRFYPSILDLGAGQERADSLLSMLSQVSKELEIVSRDHGWAPGQNLTVALTRRLTGTCKILPVRISLNEDGIWEYHISATTNTEYPGDYLDEWREMLGEQSSAAVGGGGSTSITSLLSSPFPLGGSRNTSLAVGTTSTPVFDWLPFVAQADQSVRARVTTRSRVAGVAVTPVLTKWNGSSWVAHATGAANAGVTEVEQSIIAVLTAGVTYRLEYFTDTAGASAYAIGQLENL